MSKRHLSKEEILNELLLVKAAQLDSNKFSVLYDKYYKEIFLYVYKRIDDAPITGDVVSQVFIKALKNIKKYNFQGVPFSAWLYRIASNEMNQFFRATKKRRAVNINDVSVNLLIQETEEDNFEEQMEAVCEAIQHLSTNEVELLELRFFEGRSFKEISFILGMTENNAKVKSHRLIQKIKLIIKGIRPELNE